MTSFQTLRYTCNILIYAEKIEDTKGVIWSRNSMEKHYNGQKKMETKTNIGRQNTTQKIKDWASRTPLKIEIKPDASEG